MAEAKKATRHLAIFWYLPVLIVLIVGGFVAINETGTANIVKKAKSFQGTQEASQNAEVLSTTKYDLSISLRDDFQLTGEAHTSKGNFRKRQIIEMPYDLAGETGFTLSALRIEFVASGNAALPPGLALRVRSCETAWTPTANGFTCSGPTSLVLPTAPIAGDTLAIQQPGEEIVPSKTSHLLLQIERTPEWISPLDGYTTPLSLELTGVKATV